MQAQRASKGKQVNWDKSIGCAYTRELQLGLPGVSMNVR